MKMAVKSKIKMRAISFHELKSCPKHILSAEHWTPIHKVEECGANELQITESKTVQPKMYQDIQITCVCGKEFDWTAGEQKFMNRLYEEGKVQSVVQPKRCPDCRIEKKKRFEARENQNSIQ
jgi:hypothetical protein